MIEYSLLFLLAVLPAPYLHEGSHWFIAWLGNADPEINYVFLTIPNGVQINNIRTIDAEIIRISGLAPFLWLPVAFFAITVFLIEQSPPYFFIAIVLFYTVLMATEADALAFRDPETFREKVLNNDITRTPLFLPNWVIPDSLPRF